MQCDLMFRPPNGGGPPSGLNATTHPFSTSTDAVNAFTGGWATKRLSGHGAPQSPRSAQQQPRIVFVNGEFDPWLPATVSANERPGGPLADTETQPVFVIPGMYFLLVAPGLHPSTDHC